MSHCNKYGFRLLWITLIAIMTGFLLHGTASAATTGRLVTDKDSYRPGETIEIRFMLDGFEAGAKSNSAIFRLDYDATTFELASKQVEHDVVDGFIPSAAKTDSTVAGIITYLVADMSKNYPIINGAAVFTVKLKVKPNASPGAKTLIIRGDNQDLSTHLFDLEMNIYRVASVSKSVTILSNGSGQPGKDPENPPGGNPGNPPGGGSSVGNTQGPAATIIFAPDIWWTDGVPSVSWGNSVHTTQRNGQTFIDLDVDALLSLIHKSPDRTQIWAIGVDVSGDAIFNIPSAVVKAAFDKSGPSGIILAATGIGSYSIPLSLLMDQGGGDTDAVIQLSISPASDQLNEDILSSALANQLTLLPISPISYELTITRNGKTYALEDFGHLYVQRLMRIGNRQDLNPAVTSIYMFDEGNRVFHFSPAKFVIDQNGIMYAIINRTGNSSYVAGYKQKIYRDIDTHWAKVAINNLSAKGLLNGKSALKFNPNDPITRAEFTALLVRALGLQDKKPHGQYDDIRESDWYWKEVLIAKDKKFVTGSDGSFRPNTPITRQEMAIMIANALRFVSEEKQYTKADLDSYTDIATASDWALDSIRIVVGERIMQGFGNGHFEPLGKTTRAQAAIVLENMLKALKFI